MKLANRVGIVTGGGRNIGEAIAQRFAAEGARVVVVDLDGQQAQAVAAAINAAQPGQALAMVADVSDSADVQRLVKQVVDHWGGVDILVNNVAITDHDTILDLAEDEWERVLRVSLTSVFLCSKYVARRMVESGHGGAIINIASTSGHRGRYNATAYTAAKAGVLNLTRTLAMQLAQYSIRANSITPNRIGSPVGEAVVPEGREVSNLVGRRGIPLDIAAAAVFLASDDASFISAEDLVVDGGSLHTASP